MTALPDDGPAARNAGVGPHGQTCLPPNGELVVLYDGSCPLCRAEISFYRRQDKYDALTFVDVADAATSLPGSLARGPALARFHVFSPSAGLLSGAAAFAEVWKRLPGWKLLGVIASHPLAEFFLEWAYRVFLRFRPFIVGLFSFSGVVSSSGR